MSQQFAKSQKPLGVAVVGTGGQDLARIFDALEARSYSSRTKARH